MDKDKDKDNNQENNQEKNQETKKEDKKEVKQEKETKKKKNLVVFQSKKEKTLEELNEIEKEIKMKLIQIENKVSSMEKVIHSLTIDKPESIFDSDIFYTMISAAALTLANDIIDDYFGINDKNHE